MREIVVNAEQMMELLKKHYFRGLKELAATAPEIVRCGDCMNYCGFEHCRNGICDVDAVSKRAVCANDYCSYGERREDGKID